MCGLCLVYVSPSGGVSSVLSLPAPISLDYTKLQASMQAKGNYLKSSKSKGESQGCSYTLSDAYQCAACVCYRNSQSSHAKNLNKYKEFSDEMCSFTKHI